METYVALDMNEEKEMKDAPIPHRKIEQLKKVAIHTSSPRHSSESHFALCLRLRS